MPSVRIRDYRSDYTFTVENGRLSAEGKIHLTGQQSFAFDLDQINRTPIVLGRRDPSFRSGAWTLFLSLVILWIATRPSMEAMGNIDDFRTIIICFCSAMIVIGLLMIALFFRPVKYITLIHDNSGQPMLHISRTHKNAREVDELLQLIGVEPVGGK